MRRRLQAGLQSGFIAQEVEGLLPDAVHTDAHGIKYVAYGKVVPVLVEGIKELWTRLQQLEDSQRNAPRVEDTRGGGNAGWYYNDCLDLRARLEGVERENLMLQEQVAAQEHRLKAIEAMLAKRGSV